MNFSEWINDKTVDIKEKNNAVIEISNFANFIMSSSNLDALSVDKDERRWVIFYEKDIKGEYK